MLHRINGSCRVGHSNRERSGSTWIRGITTAAAVGLCTSVLMLNGCTAWIQPGSKGFDGSKHVWTSPPNLPQTVMLIDARDDSVLWEMDVPAGKWLVTKLVLGEAKGEDPDRPDLLKYRIVEADTAWTNLKLTVDVPAAEYRRWELTLREAAAKPEPIPTIELDEYSTGMMDDEPPAAESIDLLSGEGETVEHPER